MPETIKKYKAKDKAIWITSKTHKRFKILSVTPPEFDMGDKADKLITDFMDEQDAIKKSKAATKLDQSLEAL